MKTIIHSNGSKWHGQRPDTIDQLISTLKENTLCEMFFGYTKYVHSRAYVEAGQVIIQCPIAKENGKIMFFGNFEEVSHVFRIETTDKNLINKLTSAIINNKGWKKYISLNRRENMVFV